MHISHVCLKNWRNFRSAEASLGEVTYVIGANATGKSNFLDVFRFLRDIVKLEGGGIQQAIRRRHGVAKIRCLDARQDSHVRIEVELVDNFVERNPAWRYVLEFKFDPARKRPVISAEEVYPYEYGAAIEIIKRPDTEDAKDRERLTQTSLEQVQSNHQFRQIAEHFAATAYLHLVPQLLKNQDEIAARTLDNDPFGQEFLERVARAPEKTRKSRLKRIQKVLENILPRFEEIRFNRDEASGRPHLEAKYRHFRANGAWQREDQFSDGTLRLIAIFWLLMEGDDLLLLEEPELSLNEGVVRALPRLIEEINRSRRKGRRQVIVSTHSQALLEEKGIDSRWVLRLDATKESTTIRMPDKTEIQAIEAGLTPAEVFWPRIIPTEAHKIAAL